MPAKVGAGKTPSERILYMVMIAVGFFMLIVISFFSVQITGWEWMLAFGFFGTLLVVVGCLLLFSKDRSTVFTEPT
jgi:hypothetical protein